LRTRAQDLGADIADAGRPRLLHSRPTESFWSLKDCGRAILIVLTTFVLTSTPCAFFLTLVVEGPEGGYCHWLTLFPLALFVLIWTSLIACALEKSCLRRFVLIENRAPLSKWARALKAPR
jgi:hypothetical protein